MPKIKTLAAALAALAVSGGVAAAASATTDLNMRAGPGPNYQVVGVIPAGAPVDVLDCTGSWCNVAYGRNSGYANASYLSGDRRGYVATPAYGPTYGSYGYVAPGYSPYESYAYDDDGYGYGNSYRYGPEYGYGIYRNNWPTGHNEW
jgi:uncharacterized protein YraI